MKNIRSVIWGFILVVIGVLLLLKALGLGDFNVFFSGWWTLFIIIPCLVNVISRDNITANLIGLIIGIILLLACNNVIDFELVWKLIVPIFIILIGLSCIFKDLFKKKTIIKKEEIGDYAATFSSQNIEFNKEEFFGCEINAVFGGVCLDLRNAIIKDDVSIDISSIFGGVDIYIPNNIKVKVVSNGIFGGVDNKHKLEDEKSKITVFVNADCIFGGVDIR